MRYTTEMYQKNNGSITYGRVLNYDHMRGYGFIRTEEERIFSCPPII